MFKIYLPLKLSQQNVIGNVFILHIRRFLLDTQTSTHGKAITGR